MDIKQNKNYDWLIYKKQFKEVDVSNIFFDTFRNMYSPYYEKWVNNKQNDWVYTFEDRGVLVGFLKLKFENEDEDYTDINPVLSPCKRLKIASMKSNPSYRGIGSQMMSIVFFEAHNVNAKEIYGTVPVDLPELERVQKFLNKWGFKVMAKKKSHGVEEYVYIRSLIEKPISPIFFVTPDFKLQ